MEKSSPFLQQRQGCGAGINPALRRFCRQFNLDFSSSGFTHVTPSCTNGVYSPGTPQVTLPNPLPTFCPLTHHPSFPLWNEFCLWFCGGSLSLLSSRPLDQPVHPSSHSKLLWATPGTGTSQCSLFPLPAGSASSVFPSPCSPKPLSSLQSRIPVCSGGRTKAVPALESFQMLLHISL